MLCGDHKNWHKIWESVKYQKLCFFEDLAGTLQDAQSCRKRKVQESKIGVLLC